MGTLEAIGQLFAAHYYRLLDAPRGDSGWNAALGGVYAPECALTRSWTAAGSPSPAHTIAVTGPAAAVRVLSCLGNTAHKLAHVDVQPVALPTAPGGRPCAGALVHVTGTVVVAFETRRLAEVFTLVPAGLDHIQEDGVIAEDDDRWFVVNHWRREWAVLG